MKSSKSQSYSKTHTLPQIRFEEQELSSFSGLVLYQKLFHQLGLKEKLRQCFESKHSGAIFGPATVVLWMIIHVILGFRELRQCSYYEKDPIVLRLLGLKKLPSVSTFSRCLSKMDERDVHQIQSMSQDYVLERLKSMNLKRVTLDFDGSVIGTNRIAQGTAVGFNRKKKGQRSYYPLFTTMTISINSFYRINA